MKLILSSKALLQVMLDTKPAINATAVLPVLECVLIRVTGKRMTVTATNLEMIIHRSLDVEAKEDFVFCVSHRDLLKVVKNIPEQPLTISVDKGFLRVIGDNLEVTIVTDHEENFPKDYEMQTVINFVLTEKMQSDLFPKLLIAKKFVSSDDLRPSMTGVYIDSKDGVARVAATDAHRLYFKKTEIPFTGEGIIGKGLIIPSIAIQSICSLFKIKSILGHPLEVEVKIDDNRIQFKSYNTTITARTIDAKYPTYDIVIPGNDELPITFSMYSKDMANAIKLCTEFSNKSTNQVKFDIDRLHVRYESSDMDWGYGVKCSQPVYESNIETEMTKAFNGKFVLEAISIFKDPYIKFRTSHSSTKPIIINDCVLIMPLMINN